MFNFPDTPTNGQQVTGASGVVYQFDGAKWVAAGSSALTDAPNDATLYARKSAAWSHITHSDITDWAANVPAAYVLPTASTTVLGGVKVDGSSVTISGGVISAAGGGGLADAPNDATLYARKSAAWSHVTHNDVTDWAANVPAASSTTPIMDGAAAIGVGTTWARADHVHPVDTSRYAASNPSGYQTAAQVTAALPVASATTPVMDGAAAIGVGTTWARADHVHPSDTSRLPLSGGTLTGALTPSSTAGVVGTVTNDNANAGSIGEIISSVLLTASQITLSNGVTATVTSLALTAGDWDLSGSVWINVGAGGATQVNAGISPTNAAIPGTPAINGSRSNINAAFTASQSLIVPLSTCRVSLAGPATYYLTVGVAFPSGVTTAFGSIWARRAR